MHIDSEALTSRDRTQAERARGASAAASWQEFTALLIMETQGLEAVVFARGGESDSLQAVAHALGTGVTERSAVDRFKAAAFEAERNGSAFLNGSEPSQTLISARIDNGNGHRKLAVVRLGDIPEPEQQKALLRLELAAKSAESAELLSQFEKAQGETRMFADILELMVLVDEQAAFQAAAMLLCNELATRNQAERVSLGWLRGHYVRVEAVSHADATTTKSTVLEHLAAAMEEAIDADEEIVFPSGEASPPPRFHEAFASEEGVLHVCSIPLRAAGKTIGVITLERDSTPFQANELRALRLMSDHAGRRLFTLRQRERWFGARALDWLKQKSAAVIGPEKAGMKLLAIGIALIIAVLVFVQKTYRVEATFTLRSDSIAFVPAPFDGYIEQVHFRIGDTAEPGQELIHLSTRELALEEAAAFAEQNSFLAEAQKAQSSDNIAEMQIALAKAQQAKARLERARYRLSQAGIKAPFAGVIVEGDLRERIGAPVKQGEILLKLARLTDLYVEAQVNERNVDDVTLGAAGEIAFASRPEVKYPVTIAQVEPAAEASEHGNNFMTRCSFKAAEENWWRPGMTGVCKIEAGRRSLLWLLTHRTVDFVRLHFWW